ncbi:bifunctional glucose-1-phosphatase/inositol phosphatase [Hafnia alvei]|uniref:bifunctional glucose-1-phosphatase/inositol phosphatase n=1 Tax=Hafnia alvei TaxID=569 RepID=UPI001411C844|nr:bifunctional glucose-1-phosphatase/inositol phosphatase [Hafnia alvei]QIP57599.1 bifunctional glucose-1-phosphatase/inositol phosphatase [Hafnia alvei]
MKKITKGFFSLSALALFIPLAAQSADVSPAAPEGYQLEQVLIFSRHGIRAPLVGYGDILAESTPHQWPVWKTEGGLLTPKGAEVETLFGKYMRDWLAQTGILPAGGGPTDGAVFIYANSLPRTIDTAKSFVSGAFPECSLKVNHQAKIGTMDPTFNPIITAKVTDEFKQKAIESINQHAGQGGIDGLNERLKPNYAVLQQVMGYGQSKVCTEKKTCSMAEQPNTVNIVQDKEPGITGPLRVGTGASDGFMLQYYEGYPLKEVAWGQITDEKQWQQLEEIKNLYHETLFGSSAVAQNAAAPLMRFISAALVGTPDNNALAADAHKAKVAVLVGHDSNIASLLAAMKTAEYELPKQYEKTPISGKIVFQRWHDKNDNRDLMKIEYVYQSTDQIRNATPLSLSSPAQRVVLQIDGCKIDANGFCPMDDFKTAIAKDIQGE